MPLAALILDAFILVLMKSGTKSHEKNLISCKTLITSFIVQIIIMSVSINMVLKVENR